jgi:2',3'-cyclic-nucleotide 2'-phosphodiesterase
LRILFIGDVVGRSGMDAVRQYLPEAKFEWKIDLTIVNGENAASNGFGITEAIFKELLDIGADVVTLGNHSWNQKEALEFIERTPRLIRPINYLPSAPGCGSVSIETKTGRRALIINALGRLFMEPVEDPFARIDRELNAHRLGRMSMRSWSTSIARQREKNRAPGTSATVALVSSWAPILTLPVQITKSCRAALRI